MGHQPRADRILDVAAELLLQWGYRKVTIDDIAERAEVGKGTVYLHWKTRADLLQAVFRRELAAAADELIAAVRADPQEVRLHRLTKRHFLSVMNRPLLKAMAHADVAVLGVLARERMASGHQNALEGYVELLAENGLVRPVLPIDDLVYAWHALLTGFFLAEQHPHGVEHAANALAVSVSAAFEPRDGGSERVLAELSDQVVALLTEIADNHRRSLRHAYG
ncbi:TetR/AcrR family transcriptional regulator [Nocardia sp. NPDC001965]